MYAQRSSCSWPSTSNTKSGITVRERIMFFSRFRKAAKVKSFANDGVLVGRISVREIMSILPQVVEYGLPTNAEQKHNRIKLLSDTVDVLNDIKQNLATLSLANTLKIEDCKQPEQELEECL